MPHFVTDPVRLGFVAPSEQAAARTFQKVFGIFVLLRDFFIPREVAQPDALGVVAIRIDEEVVLFNERETGSLIIVLIEVFAGVNAGRDRECGSQ